MITMRRLSQSLSSIRETSPEMPLGALVVFLEIIASAETQQDKGEPPMLKHIAETLGMPYSTVVRHVLFLSKVKEPGVPGLGWIETHTWPLDRRQKYATPSPAGLRAISKFKQTAGID